MAAFYHGSDAMMEETYSRELGRCVACRLCDYHYPVADDDAARAIMAAGCIKCDVAPHGWECVEAGTEAPTAPRDALLDVLVRQVAEESDRAARAWASFVAIKRESGRASAETFAALRRYNAIAEHLYFIEYQARQLVPAVAPRCATCGDALPYAGSSCVGRCHERAALLAREG